MDIEFGKGVTATVEAAAQSDEWLLNAQKEIAQAMEARGLVSAVTGVLLVKATTSFETVPTPDTKETLTAQLGNALKGHQAVVNSLNTGRRGKNVIAAVEEAALATELEAWLTDDRLAYVKEAQERDPGLTFILGATPNILASPKDIIKAAKAFGKKQSSVTFTYDPLYEQYSAIELSGTTPDNGRTVMFSLFPNKLTKGMKGTVEQQRQALKEMQAINPYLKVPSVFEAVTLWETVRAQEGSVGDYNRTYIRHFDLDTKQVDGWSAVPGSYVVDLGDAGLRGSVATDDDYGRVSMG